MLLLIYYSEYILKDIKEAIEVNSDKDDITIHIYDISKEQLNSLHLYSSDYSYYSYPLLNETYNVIFYVMKFSKRKYNY